MTEEITLGPALMRELPQMAVLSRDLVEGGLVWNYTAPTLLRMLRRGDHELVVARKSTHVCGFAVMQVGFDAAHLVLLAVDIPFRRRGIATALMDWLERVARNAGAFDVQLEVRADNLGAQTFYRRRGYHPVTRVTGYYNGVEDAVRMRGDLRVRA